MKITIGSRGSDLALWQAHFVKDALQKLGHQIDIKIIVTQGDKIQNLSFDKMEGKGFFTKEIEEALLNKEIDLAVHSHKDLETTNPTGLTIGAVSYREKPTDLLLIRKESSVENKTIPVKVNAVIGTSAARRKTQLMRLRPDCSIKDLRGNVPTRIQKLRDGLYDAIVLATAGVERLKLDLSEFIAYEFKPDQFIPAPAQGVLALQIREVDLELKNALKEIHHTDVAESIAIERNVMKLMQGGCQLPLGVYCEQKNKGYQVWASFSKDANSAAKTFYFEADSNNGLAEKITQQLKSEQ